ncbi:MAG TPA: MmgE/PrpD family protein [Bacillota bacterium]|jgi:2-methylcitrate dehydratase PrpD|nr:MmgE/PrpD family protein [Bacillota bacterium]HOJ83099.1 MmgE/PrpD family protein [Bacillota bacterium]HOL15694.1 MmgE/PrpD family protein [Bacillota bacterium]
MLRGNLIVSSFIRELTWDSLPPAVQQQARLCSLDQLGAIIAGSLAKGSKIMAGQALEHWPGDAATVLLFNAKASLPGAVLANAFSANALDIDDGYRAIKGHPGAIVFPAVLAAAEKRKVAGKDFLAALVAAYEVAIRAGIAWHDYHAEYHGSGSWGSLGAAAGVAKILGLQESEIINALGTAEYHAPIMPMMRCIDYPAMTKDGIAWGAMVGTVSALLAGAGYTGIPSLLGMEEYRHLVESLGREYLILNLYFKPYACCRWAQPAVTAALELREKHNLNPENIDRIVVHTFDAATRLWLKHPSNTEEAQYNMAYPIAAALLEGEVGPRQVLDENLQNREILELAARVETVKDELLERQFPAKCLCELKLILKDGRELRSGTVGAIGDLDNPLGVDGIEQKFTWLASHVFREEQVAKIKKLVWELDKLDNLKPLIDSLRSPENS